MMRLKHLTQELLDGPGGADLACRVIGVEHCPQPGQGLRAQLVAGTQQQPAVRVP
jgi:hypothetical protein